MSKSLPFGGSTRAGLEVCHYAEEFTLRRIRSLDRREKLAFECP
jgi:hypothetical protein